MHVVQNLKIFCLIFPGQCLNFNCMFVLVLMLRHCITFLRTRGFSVFLPLDQHIYLHKLTGCLIFIYSVVHTIMHLLNFSKTFFRIHDQINQNLSRTAYAQEPLLHHRTSCIIFPGLDVLSDPVVNAQNYTLSEWILTSKPGLYGLVGGAANPTGVALIVILSIMFICSQTFVRRGGSFEVCSCFNRFTYLGIVDFLLDASLVRAFLDATHFPWTQFLEMGYSAGSRLHHRTCHTIGVAAIGTWEDLHQFWASFAFSRNSFGDQTSASFRLLPGRLRFR